MAYSDSDLTTYPAVISTATAHNDGETVLAAHMNAAQAEIIRLEVALGVNPKGTAASVAARVSAAEGLVPTHAGLTAAIHGVTGTVVGTTDMQTLTNKTLTNPIINGATLSGTLAGSPTFAGSVTFQDITVLGNLNGAGVTPGFVGMFLCAVAPTGWLALDGTVTVTTANYHNLWLALGGVGSYVLPDFSDRVPVGSSGTKAVGALGGSDTAALVANNLPAHTHPMSHGHSVTVDAGGVHEHTGQYQSFGIAVRTGGYDLVRPAVQNNYASQGNRGWEGHNNTPPVVTFTGGAHGHSASASSLVADTAANSGTGAPVNVAPRSLALRFLIKT